MVCHKNNRHVLYWNYERCLEEAKKYASRGTFYKGNQSAYNSAYKNHWLDDYTWFAPSRTIKKWTEDTCREEAKKYTSRKEFYTKNQSAYSISHKNGWLKDYTWLKFQSQKPYGYWTRERCIEEAKKYKTVKEFVKKSSNCYKHSLEYNLLPTFTWFWIDCKPKGYWNNYQHCWDVAKNCKTRNEFHCTPAYIWAKRNDWIDDYVWLSDKRLDFIDGRIDMVYVYEFKEQNAAYIGRTLERCQKRRDWAHIFDHKDTVSQFSKQNSVAVPEMKIIFKNLTLTEGVQKEQEVLEDYKSKGWTILNRTKTGSIGAIAKGKWNYDRCYEEAKKYSCATDFCKNNSSAYGSACRNNWLKDYIWFRHTPRKKWDVESFYNEVRKHKNKEELKAKSPGAYAYARRNKLLDSLYTKKNNPLQLSFDFAS